MKTDLEKAREIVRRHRPFVGGGSLTENIAKAVAEGIALGRAEMAASGGVALGSLPNTTKRLAGQAQIDPDSWGACCVRATLEKWIFPHPSPASTADPDSA